MYACWITTRLTFAGYGMRGALTPDLPHMSLAVVTGAQLVDLTVSCTLGMRTYARAWVRDVTTVQWSASDAQVGTSRRRCRRAAASMTRCVRGEARGCGPCRPP